MVEGIDGVTIGVLVWRELGLRVGLTEGARVGRELVGSVLGLALEAKVGEGEGRVVGGHVGTRKGLDVNATLGTGVGRKVGLIVGLYVFVGPLLLG